MHFLSVSQAVIETNPFPYSCLTPRVLPYLDRDDVLPASEPLSSRRVDANPWGSLWARDNDDDYPPCEKSCAPLFQPTDVKRRHIDALRSRNVTLGGRDIKLPGDDMNTFMVNEVPKAKSIVWTGRKGSDMNTASLKTYGRTKVSLATSGLCGCTSLWVISRKGVYATHYWESISFSPDKQWYIEGEKTSAAVFRRTVLGPLQTGEMSGTRLAQAKLDPVEIADDFIKAYIVRPDRSCGRASRVDGYRKQWDQIKSTVGEVIPALDPETHPDRWKEIIYQRLDRDNNDILYTAAGHILFKFDPDDFGKKRAVLWVEHERTPYHDDAW